MSDLINRADAIEAVRKCVVESELLADWNKAMESAQELLSALPSAETHEIRTETHGVCLDLISREDALQCKPEFLNPNPNDKLNNYPIGWNDAIKVWYADIKSLPSADAEPKWNCTANFVAEQLERLKDMTDKERWDFFIRFFSPSADAVPQLRQTDTLIIADALRYLAKDTERHLADRTRADALRQQFLKYGASMCKGGAE